MANRIERTYTSKDDELTLFVEFANPLSIYKWERLSSAKKLTSRLVKEMSLWKGDQKIYTLLPSDLEKFSFVDKVFGDKPMTVLGVLRKFNKQYALKKVTEEKENV